MSAVPLPATEAYEAIQKGTVDGALFPWEAMPSFRLNELVKAHLEVPGGLCCRAFVIIANTKAFDNLTPANKAALMKASGEAGAALFGKAWDAADERAAPTPSSAATLSKRWRRRSSKMAAAAAVRHRRMAHQGRQEGTRRAQAPRRLAGDDQGGRRADADMNGSAQPAGSTG